VLRDISEKQKLQVLANRNERMKELGEMAATIAHEIRNPLGGIRGYASLLYRDLSESPHLQEMAASLIEGTKTLEKLVGAILQFSRPTPIQMQSIELGAYLKEIAKFIKMDPALSASIHLQMHIPNDPLLAPIDPEMFKSALLNLIYNASQAMPKGGIITLSLMKLDSSCQLAISDTGVGIHEKDRQNLFSPFFTTKQKGNGIGLVEAQKIIQAHRGTIDIRSQLGKGTTVTITLPLRIS
jgi:signal transduction histidine kinase